MSIFDTLASVPMDTQYREDEIDSVIQLSIASDDVSNQAQAVFFNYFIRGYLKGEDLVVLRQTLMAKYQNALNLYDTTLTASERNKKCAVVRTVWKCAQDYIGSQLYQNNTDQVHSYKEAKQKLSQLRRKTKVPKEYGVEQLNYDLQRIKSRINESKDPFTLVTTAKTFFFLN